MTNVPTNAATNIDNNESNDGPVDAEAGGEDGAQPSTSTENTHANASNYDASKARKSKKRADSEVWQEKILRCLEPVEVPKPEPAPKKDFLEQALCTVGMQMRENLSHNEVLDLIEDIQGMVNRACREKRRRIEMANQVSNNQMYQGPQGPQGPMAVPVNFENQQQHQQSFYNTF